MKNLPYQGRLQDAIERAFRLGTRNSTFTYSVVNSEAFQYEPDAEASNYRLATFLASDFIAELFHESYAGGLDETGLTSM